MLKAVNVFLNVSYIEFPFIVPMNMLHVLYDMLSITYIRNFKSFGGAMREIKVDYNQNKRVQLRLT